MKKSKWMCVFLVLLLLQGTFPVQAAEQLVSVENSKPLVETICKVPSHIKISNPENQEQKDLNYEYDDTGRLIGILEKTQKGDNESLTKWIFQYDTTGKLFSSLSYKQDGSIIDGFCEEYDENGSIKTKTVYNNGNIFEYYEYNSIGQIIYSEEYSNKWQYEYNEDGSVSKKIFFDTKSDIKFSPAAN